ncbi:hypothetical protein CC85DRAFT_282858 [Cutaneotrichosporon oleaginosum]|uniref:Uncharacterized protein n=1 Tax=Cutaneotrichosporon oleaginosum TaxID=879819 RepID=A0A0J0XW96_9TREE|nr:uncharacterized protein CC85DRAFT_282858 [Cutaneotrichosporon oleaginosum]KLT45370.1 hypothetical protein CC85DRAFT_282858 [Cutaneotrichosporon oleaginosum]TXT14806.1 hypothetical protein COLE_00999 [Cutaneotrichosporon oleaginosum]
MERARPPIPRDNPRRTRVFPEYTQLRTTADRPPFRLPPAPRTGVALGVLAASYSQSLPGQRSCLFFVLCLFTREHAAKVP